MAGATHVYQVYIKTTPEKLWDAMVNPDLTSIYIGGRIQSPWEPGARYSYEPTTMAGPLHYGTVLEVDPPRRLVQTFEHDRFAEMAGGKEQPSRVTWEIEQMGEACRLTLTHEFPGGEGVYSQGASQAWPMVLSGLKTLLETGEGLRMEFGESRVGG